MMKTKIQLLLASSIFFIAIIAKAQTDTTWHVNGVDSIKTDNHAQIGNGLKVKGHLVADSIKVKSIHIGDSSLVIAGNVINGGELIQSSTGIIGIGAGAPPNSGLFSFISVGIGIDTPQHSLHVNDSQVVVAPRPVNMAFTGYGNGWGTGTTAKDGFQIGINAGKVAELNQQENLDMLFYTGNNNPAGTVLNAERMRIIGRTGAWQGNVAIGTSSPDSSALLHVSSTNKGVLIPNVDLDSVADGLTVILPATSLLVYNTGAGLLSPAGYYYNAGTSIAPNWVRFGTSTGWDIIGNNGTTASTAAIGSTVNNNFIGTTDNKDWVMATNNLERARIKVDGKVGIGTAAPVLKLEVIGTFGLPATSGTTQTGILRLGQSAGTAVLDIGNNGSVGSWLQSTRSTNLGTNDPLLFNPNGGNVGIGNTAPGINGMANTLTIQSSSTRAMLELSTSQADANGTVVGQLGFFGTANTSGKQIAAIYAVTNGSTATNRGGDLVFYTKSNGGAIAQNMVITKDGNVGIGTSTPLSKLDVEGGLAVGASYSGSIAAPSNGMIVQGKVGIGNSNPSTLLHISGGGNFTFDPTPVTSSYTTSFVMDNNSLKIGHDGSTQDIRFQTNSTSRITIEHGGDVGIGLTNPAYKLDVTGDIHNTGVMAVGMAPSGTYAITVNGSGLAFGGSWVPSDQFFKTDIDSLQNALATIKQLKPKTYYFDTANVWGLNFSNKKQYGFLAQELEQVLPDVIKTSTKNEDVDTLGNVVHPAVTFKAVNYTEFIALLTKGIQELQQKNDSLKTEVNNYNSVNSLLQEQVNQLITNSISTQEQLNQLLDKVNNCCTAPTRSMQIDSDETQSQQTDIKLSDTQSLVLQQNVPNPFKEKTTINYVLPETYSKAELLFYNSQGKLIKSAELQGKGNGQLNVFADDLSNGVYSYTLVIDSKIVETKRMIKQ